MDLRKELIDFIRRDPRGALSFLQTVFLEAGDVSRDWICGPLTSYEIILQGREKAAQDVIPSGMLRVEFSRPDRPRRLYHLFRGMGKSTSEALEITKRQYVNAEDPFAYEYAECLDALGCTVSVTDSTGENIGWVPPDKVRPHLRSLLTAVRQESKK